MHRWRPHPTPPSPAGTTSNRGRALPTGVPRTCLRAMPARSSAFIGNLCRRPPPMWAAAASRRFHPAKPLFARCGVLPQARNAREVYQPFRECGFVRCGRALYPGRITGHEVVSMFEPIQTNPERARVRLRDLGAAWVLVALILVVTVLPGALRAAKTEA